MRNTPHTHHAPANHPGVTLTLTEDQLHAIGLNKLPVAGAEVHIRATATVAHPDDADEAQDSDHDAGVDAHGGDMDADDGNVDEGAGGDRKDPADAQSDSGEAAAPALILHLTALTLMPFHRTPDKVLYGSGD